MSTYSQPTSVAATMLVTHRSNKDSIVSPASQGLMTTMMMMTMTTKMTIKYVPVSQNYVNSNISGGPSGRAVYGVGIQPLSC
jgi:hypothetical protein